ncbi:acetate kinase (acetokinase) [Companilactobacillus paralimentarius DSM 13238 = JCM 10415]|jgi:acetate kinase|uniref:Acetate kinase n=1 Tax=Companilactobacillus paralimentarius DSM 13238 = JCM 10415 TaxID=1122151 RepID=A0A0R1PIT1_9LACO|nr:acetate kinase [Companilactobacillus paralimentarius]KAE9565189.1 acetate kinase [Companilactobacillus paralimentarius]KRL32062.1 acetate kinase (acetokinase) [Companilactobacillus paralimentarius DSM 13238 = JCM 10415]QFR69960.1 acetate/propionate family kinase [Companilactobacillus paralimentarius]
MSKIMAVNSGSSTLKWKLYTVPDEKVIAKGMVDRLGLPDSVFEVQYNGKKISELGDIPDHTTAVNKMLDKLIELKIIKNYDEITGVGHRVVAGGSIFKDSVIVTPRVVQQIRNLSEFAPLHNPGQATGIEAFEKILPNVPQVAVFDTSFHQTIDPVNYLYSIPYEYYEKYGVRKFGAHGTSHRYVSQAAADYLQRPLSDLKIISAHLGSGASIDAIEDGKSVDTSMGFTPLAGITMSTRSGDVDPSLVAYLMQKMKITDPDEMVKILNTKSGLLGLSGVSPDMRDLLATKDENHRSDLAIKIFVNRIVKYIGSYIALLGGADVLIFTAGVGAGSAEIREDIVDHFNYRGIRIDKEANENGKGIRRISTKDSTTDVLVVPTDEELMIVRDVVRLIKYSN